MSDAVAWDAALSAMGGHLLQSWGWGEFKRQQGWSVERVSGNGMSGSWMAQILFRSAGPISLAYVPYGPALTGDAGQVALAMNADVDVACRRHRAALLLVEPSHPFEAAQPLRPTGFVRGEQSFQPRRTMILPVLDDESLLQAMHHKTRYHIRLATRHGSVVSLPGVTDQSIDEFYQLLVETSARSRIQLLPRQYMVDLLHALDRHGALLLIRVGGQPVAAALLARLGETAYYLFAGSSTERRGQGAGALLVYASLQWARDAGCRSLDLGSVETEGLHTFKAGFGGDVVVHPAPLERRYRPLLAWGISRAIQARGM